MFRIRTRQMAAVLVASLASPVALMAQWNFANDCCISTPQQYVAASAPVVTSACQYMQPVTTMVAKQMQVTAYRPEQTVEKRPVQKMRWVAREATAYRQEMETRTIEVPAMTYQTVTEMQTKMVNKGRWQTQVQPVVKMAPYQYDNRQGMVGSMNRMGYQMRAALQPNFTTSRQFIPQVCQCSVPVQRQVAVQTTRKVTQLVPKTVAYKITQQVAEYYTDHENVTVTTMKPYQTTQTVHEARVHMAFVDPATGMAIAPQGTQTAAEPQPTRAAENDDPPTDVERKKISYPKPAKSSSSIDNRIIRQESTSKTLGLVLVKPVTRRAATVATTESDGWKTHASTPNELPASKVGQGKSSVVSK